MTIEPVYCFINEVGDVLGFKMERGAMIVRPAVPEEGVLPYFARERRFITVFEREVRAYAKLSNSPMRLVRLGVAETMESYRP